MQGIKEKVLVDTEKYVLYYRIKLEQYIAIERQESKRIQTLCDDIELDQVDENEKTTGIILSIDKKNNTIQIESNVLAEIPINELEGTIHSYVTGVIS